MISTRQPIRTTILHVRSKDALQLDQTLNTNFSIQLSDHIMAQADEEIHAQMISAEIPYSCYNISPSVKNNTIVFNTNQTFTLPPKNYDDLELVRVINAEASFPFSVTHDIYTNKLTFTNTSGVTAVINWTSSLANKLLGYGEAVDETILAGATTISPGMLDLATIHSFFIFPPAYPLGMLTYATGTQKSPTCDLLISAACVFDCSSVPEIIGVK